MDENDVEVGRPAAAPSRLWTSSRAHPQVLGARPQVLAHDWLIYDLENNMIYFLDCSSSSVRLLRWYWLMHEVT